MKKKKRKKKSGEYLFLKKKKIKNEKNAVDTIIKHIEVPQKALQKEIATLENTIFDGIQDPHFTHKFLISALKEPYLELG